LDHAMRRKTRAVAGNLAALKADIAHRLDADNNLITLPVAALKAGDRILIRPGERIPADGFVVHGVSEIDASLVTGETSREPVAAGSAIHAGSMNYSGALTLKVTATGTDTLLAEVERLLEKAVSGKSRYLRLADRAARLYAPLVHTTAALTAVGWLLAGASIHDAIVTAIAVLIITCPCALALAIPAVQVVASGALFRSDIILNAADAIERLAESDTIVFDKTGTLTLPEPRVDNAAEIDPELLRLAARLALSSRHPLAVAVAREVPEQAPIEGAIEEPGQGVRATIAGLEARLGSPAYCGVPFTNSPATNVSGSSTIAFAYAGRSIQLAVRQKLRPDAITVVKTLVARNYEVVILSGDHPAAVEPVAAALGVQAWRASLKPADKISAIEALKAAGRHVMMVGDGLNDAPSLAAAHVALSPISAVDITQTHADAIFLGERLGPVLDAILISKRAHRLMLQNLWIAVIYNTIAVPIAISGLVTPLVAALAMSGSSLLVTLNSLRAGPHTRTRTIPGPSLKADLARA
jgi:P-type Cu2+ transporter